MINGIKPNIKSSTLNEVDKSKLGITYDEGIDRLLVEIQNIVIPISDINSINVSII